jgi:hypothetical protein
MSAYVQIKLDGTGHGEIGVDGHDLSRITRGIRIVSRVGQPTTVELQLVAGQFSTEVDAPVRLDPETCALLERLGWTPPGGAS